MTLKPWLMSQDLSLTEEDFGKWQSDLHVRSKPGVVDAINKYRDEENIYLRYSHFTSNIDGSLWIEIPFNYIP
tara:strand:- start:62 stop:280 length:219 start_codon:yes stop_codon:yes gene_type:complete